MKERSQMFKYQQKCIFFFCKKAFDSKSIYTYTTFRRKLNKMKVNKHKRHLTAKVVLNSLNQSTDQLASSTHHKTYTNTENHSILRMKSSPTNLYLLPNDCIKENTRPHTRHKTHEATLLNTLYSNILKHKDETSKTIITSKQKERFMHRFSQTIKEDCFRVSGFELDAKSLGFVFSYIKASGNIKKIVLDNNQLGYEGVLKLASLVSTTDIHELSLVSVGIGNKEASILFEALSVRATIKRLNISSIEGVMKNKITSEGVQSLRTLLNSPVCCLEHLQMDYVLLGNEGLKAAFHAIKTSSLEYLSLSKNDLTFRSISSFFSNISNIPVVKLDLSKNNLSNEGLKVISSLLGVNYGRTALSVNLNMLNISNNNINSIAFETFCREAYCNQTLEVLILDDNPLGQGQRFFNVKYFIHKNWRLKHLSLANISCVDKDLRCICEGMETNRSLQHLNISKNQVDCDTLYSIFSMLNKNKFLRQIQLNNCKICDNALGKVDLISNSSFPRIEQIQMQNNYIGNKGAALLKQMLTNNQNILKVALAKNCIGERSLLEIAEVLKDNQRKRPFERQMNYFNSVIDLYEEKKKILKEEVEQLKDKEERLQTKQLIADIRHKDKLQTTLKHKIRLQKRSIATIKQRLAGHWVDMSKEISSNASKQSSFYMTEATPIFTESSIHP